MNTSPMHPEDFWIWQILGKIAKGQFLQLSALIIVFWESKISSPLSYLCMSLEVDQVYAGSEADSLPLPLA